MRLLPIIEFPVAIIIGGIVAMILGLLVCLPTLRLRGDYLAIITLAFGEIVRNVLINLKVLGLSLIHILKEILSQVNY